VSSRLCIPKLRRHHRWVCLSVFAEFSRIRFRIRLKSHLLNSGVNHQLSYKFFSPLIFALEPYFVAYRIVWRKILGHRILSSDSKFMTEYIPKRELRIIQKIGPIGNTQKFVVFWSMFTECNGVNLFAKCVSPEIKLQTKWLVLHFV
jgi:hypothetical protein